MNFTLKKKNAKMWGRDRKNKIKKGYNWDVRLGRREGRGERGEERGDMREKRKTILVKMVLQIAIGFMYFNDDLLCNLCV